MRVNLDAVFRYCREFGADMFRRERGPSLSFLLSPHSGRATSESVAYSVSTAGIARMSRLLASEWAHRGVRVNAIALGFVATDMPLGARLKMHTI
jgi:NAD(P)-dependent dehydrogenase (short-subunit alcohol dehydrogenase family)